MVREPAPRFFSPLFFILAGLCFLLPFTGVSCNTTTAQTALSALGGLSTSGGSTGAAEMQALQKCLDSLNNYNLATYSGLNLATGSAPKVAAQPPSGCSQAEQATGGSISSATPTNSADLKVGVQPLILVALAVMLLGLLLSLFRYALRGFVVAGASVVAIVLLLVASGSVSTAVTDKIQADVTSSAGSSLGSLSGIDFGSYFTVTMELGLILAMVALGVCAVYNVAAEGVRLAGRGGGRAAPAAAHAYGTGAPVAPPWSSPPQPLAPPGSPPASDAPPPTFGSPLAGPPEPPGSPPASEAPPPTFGSPLSGPHTPPSGPPTAPSVPPAPASGPPSPPSVPPAPASGPPTAPSGPPASPSGPPAPPSPPGGFGPPPSPPSAS